MKPSPQVAAKTERLLNLVICLLYTRRPLTKEQIREAVPQYADAGSDEAFDRMFDRDKDELRDLGIPLATQQVDVLFEDEVGYRIDRRDYALPEIEFTPDELTVLGLASRTWAQASLAGPAAQALRKLAAAGVERDDASLVGLEPRVRTVEPAFDAVRGAVVSGTPIRFSYRKSGGSAQDRHVEPWSMKLWHGRWYLVGHDTDRDAARVFRLERIQGAVREDGPAGSFVVPADHDPTALILRSEPDPDAPPVRTHVRVRDGAGSELRRRAESAEPDGGVPGWTRLTLTTTDVHRLAQELAWHGPDVVALDPPGLVDAVVTLLRGVAGDRATEVPA